MPNIIVVGGAGFLGRHLCNRLLHDLRGEGTLYCLDNLVTGKISNIRSMLDREEKFHFIEYDITNDLEILVKEKKLPEQIDEIYHLACIASPSIYKKYSIETLNTNFIGTMNVLKLALKTGSKVLFTSSSEVYGNSLVHPQPETYYGNVNPMGERGCYDEGKRIGETLMYEYRKKHGIDTKVVRIFNTYGPYMDLNDGRVIPNFIKNIIENKPLIIYGDGNQTRSFCYCTDIINGIRAMMRSNESGPINLGNPDFEVTLNDLVKIYESHLDVKLQIENIEGTMNDPKQRKPNINVAKEKLKWDPWVSLKWGLLETLNHYGLAIKEEEKEVKRSKSF